MPVPELLLDKTKRDQPLSRYMKLSTLLLMLGRNLAFVPTIEKLREDDRSEGDFQAVDFKDFRRLTDNQKQYLDRWATRDQRVRLRNAATRGWEGDVYFEIWAEKLRHERAAWCWYGSDVESMAQWRIYGNNGVAIRTTVNRLLQGLRVSRSSNVFQCRSITYWNRESRRAHPDRNLITPFFFKREAYAHENEYRVIFPIDGPLYPDEAKRPGFLLDIDATTLIDEVVISPMIPASEFEGVADVIRNIPRLQNPYAPQVEVRSSDAFAESVYRDDTSSSASHEMSNLPIISNSNDEHVLNVADFYPKRFRKSLVRESRKAPH